jgi:flagellar protein FlgJ
MTSPTLPSAPLPPSIPAVGNSLSFQGLNQLSAVAKANPQNPQAIKAVAQQFEALLMQQMLTAMNATSLGPDLLGDTSGPMFKSLFTQQIATTISQGQGIGLATFLAKELATRYGATHNGDPTAAKGMASGANAPVVLRQPTEQLAHLSSAVHVSPLLGERQSGSTTAPASEVADAVGSTMQKPQDPTTQALLMEKAQAFIQSIFPSVQSAATALKVSPVAILAQAALEKVWVCLAPGNNLFGIMAGVSCHVTALTSVTNEVSDGISHLGDAAFRAYKSAADSVQNYAQMLLGSPRFQGVRGHGSDIAGFASALQRSGYATDPHYASKLLAIAQSPTMRGALAALGLQESSSLAAP